MGSLTMMMFLSVLCINALLWQVKEVAADEMYLIIGQSNASGRGDLPSRGVTSLDGVTVFNGNRFVRAFQDVNKHSSVGKPHLIGYSFAYTFAEEMQDRLNTDILLVSNARGGTKIRDWLPGEIYYNEAVGRVRNAIARSGTRLSGVLWHQGEGDGNNRNYDDDLRELIEGLRDEFGRNLPFIAGELSYARGDSSTRINDQLHDLEGRVSNYDVVSASGLNAPDNTHFDRSSLRTLGRRYARAMVRI